MEKEKYEHIQIKVTEFDAEDVITTSAPVRVIYGLQEYEIDILK